MRYPFIFLILFNCLVPQVFANPDSSDSLPKEDAYTQKYNFTVDYYTKNFPSWKKTLSRFKEKPNVNYLEIGVFEGGTLIWVLENILTHPSSRATCIDVFPGEIKKRLMSNLKISGFADKVRVITGDSQFELKSLPLNSFDIIYIDGDHTAAGVLTDAVLSWQLLKIDGLLIFDDYFCDRDYPLDLRPEIAIEAFVTTHRNFIEIIHRQHQLVLR